MSRTSPSGPTAPSSWSTRAATGSRATCRCWDSSRTAPARAGLRTRPACSRHRGCPGHPGPAAGPAHQGAGHEHRVHRPPAAPTPARTSPAPSRRPPSAVSTSRRGPIRARRGSPLPHGRGAQPRRRHVAVRTAAEIFEWVVDGSDLAAGPVDAEPTRVAFVGAGASRSPTRCDGSSLLALSEWAPSPVLVIDIERSGARSAAWPVGVPRWGYGLLVGAAGALLLVRRRPVARAHDVSRARAGPRPRAEPCARTGVDPVTEQGDREEKGQDGRAHRGAGPRSTPVVEPADRPTDAPARPGRHRVRGAVGSVPVACGLLVALVMWCGACCARRAATGDHVVRSIPGTACPGGKPRPYGTTRHRG